MYRASSTPLTRYLDLPGPLENPWPREVDPERNVEQHQQILQQQEDNHSVLTCPPSPRPAPMEVEVEPWGQLANEHVQPDLDGSVSVLVEALLHE